jgi:hypothetical protein
VIKHLRWIGVAVAMVLVNACGGGESTSTTTSGPSTGGGAGLEAGAGSGGSSVVNTAGAGGSGTAGSANANDASSEALHTADATTGACNDDNDCVVREGCPTCGVCGAKTDPPPMVYSMCELCAPVPPHCVCVDHHCGAGALTTGTKCDPAHDLCADGFKCCARCGGFVLEGGAPVCSDPVCTAPTNNQPYCPPGQ